MDAEEEGRNKEKKKCKDLCIVNWMKKTTATFENLLTQSKRNEWMYEWIIWKYMVTTATNCVSFILNVNA